MSLVETSPQFAPTEYTAAMVQFLRAHPALSKGRRICEIGAGNGAISAMAASMGADHVTITDVESSGLAAARACIELVSDVEIDEHLGSVWDPLGAARFDLILANLPHFPAKALTLPGRRPSWSAGGADGRSILDPFIAKLADHLTPRGHALFTHNRFVGLEQTRDAIEAAGLSLSFDADFTVHIAPIKAVALAPTAIIDTPELFRAGPHLFGRVCLALVSNPLQGQP